MNKEELWKTRYNNLNKYFPTRHINNISINTTNSLEHELSKFMAGWITAKGGDMRILFHQVVPHVIDFCNKVKFMEGWFFEPRCFITEVKDLNNLKRQFDFVCLDSNERIEFETGKSYEKKDDVTTYEVK